MVGKTIASISTGGLHTCALTADNKIYCWGRNTAGQLGNNSINDSSIPVLVDPTNVMVGKTIASLKSGNSHTCALMTNGKTYCWGNNEDSQLGGAYTQINSLLPIIATDISSTPTPTITFYGWQLYIAWPGNNKTVCKEWTVPNGSTVKGFYVSQETEGGCDDFIVRVDGVERYRASGIGNSRYVDITASPGTVLTACMTTDGSVQEGYGGEVTGVVYN